MANEFSTTWFETFLSPGTAAPVHRELDFIQKHLPVARFRRVLDVACGIGRHAGPLVSLGYDVLGIDRSAAALEVARQRDPTGASYQLLDMLDLDTLPEAFDAVLCLWQSFGYGDANENRRLLEAMARRLRPGGRILLDVYNADALRQLPAETTEVRAGRTVSTSRTFEGRRFRVEIHYSDSSQTDTHEWLVYTPAELVQAGVVVGLRPLHSCAWFDEAIPPSAADQRMQVLFERPSPGPGI